MRSYTTIINKELARLKTFDMPVATAIHAKLLAPNTEKRFNNRNRSRVSVFVSRLRSARINLRETIVLNSERFCFLRDPPDAEDTITYSSLISSTRMITPFSFTSKNGAWDASMAFKFGLTSLTRSPMNVRVSVTRSNASVLSELRIASRVSAALTLSPTRAAKRRKRTSSSLSSPIPFIPLQHTLYDNFYVFTQLNCAAPIAVQSDHF